MKKHYVKYKISGFGDERRAGPYDTEDEARSHADDIRGYEGVQYAIVVDEEVSGSGPG